MSSSNDPIIVNRRPDEGDTDVTATTPFRFGVRDVSTRADLSTVYAAVLYSNLNYRPDEDLPLEDDTLAAAGRYFSTFDDASGTTEPGNPCDQLLEEAGDDTVYRIEKSDADGTAQEGVLFVSLEANDPRPCSFSSRLDLSSALSTRTTDYVSFSDFTGALMGLVYWPENTGVFLFFRDDGTKKVTVAGPATDGTGTRTVVQTTTFDWSAETYTYTIVLDPSVFRRKVLVFATDTTGAETLLAELALDDFNTFLASVRMGNLFAEDMPGQVTGVVGLDAYDMGDFIEVYEFGLANYGAVLVAGGGPTGASTVTVTPLDSLLTLGTQGLSPWSFSGSGVLEVTATAAKLTVEAGSDTYFVRDEPDLCSKEWLVLGRLAGKEAGHPGYYQTGMALEVADGDTQFRMHLLDSFAANAIGIEDEDAAEDPVLVGYRLDTTEHDWEEAFNFELAGSTSRDELRLLVNGAEACTHTYASGYPASDASHVRFGFLETAGEYSGEFYLFYLWLFPACSFYEARDLTYPEAQGWQRSSSGGARAVSSSGLELDCTVAGTYDIYYIEDATYDATSGASAIFTVEVEAWTDAAGASSPPRTEIGPIAAVRTTTVAAQLFFVRGLDGTVYLYLPHDDSTVADVLAQSEAGRAISVEVDLTVEHTFILTVKPFHHIRVHVDLDTTPVIEVAWADMGTGLRALPTNMPATAVVAVGSLGEDGGVQASFVNFRASIGRGYDVSTSPRLSEAELQEHVYGSTAALVIDAQDED